MTHPLYKGRDVIGRKPRNDESLLGGIKDQGSRMMAHDCPDCVQSNVRLFPSQLVAARLPATFPSSVFASLLFIAWVCCSAVDGKEWTTTRDRKASLDIR